MLDDDQLEELTIDSIIALWFRYEPKNDSVSEILKNEDKKKFVSDLFEYGAWSGELKTHIEMNEISEDIYPDYITGKFKTQKEDQVYRGLPYTKTVITETIFIKLIDIKNFLVLKKERPPCDSPLFEKLQILGDFSDQSAAPCTRYKPLLERQQEAILFAIKALDLEAMTIPRKTKIKINNYCEENFSVDFANKTAFTRAWQIGNTKLWKLEDYESYTRRGNN